MLSDVQLGSHEVDVWVAAPEELAGDDAETSARALLSRDELQRLERFRFTNGRQLFLATRAMVRLVLSRYEPVPPDAWQFTIGPHGRPALAGSAPPLRFNLSNTFGLVVCAVARHYDVGVDVENVNRAAPIEVAESYFAASEVTALHALPAQERPHRFFAYWTLKESYVKARGLGLAIPLDRFAFVLAPGSAPRIVIDPSLCDGAASYHFSQHWPTADHIISLCIRSHGTNGSAIPVQWRRLGPLCSNNSPSRSWERCGPDA